MDLNAQRVESVAAQRLESTPQFRGHRNKVSFHCRDGILVVTGRVPSFYLKQILQKAVEGLEGIEMVDNRVDVVAVDGLSSVRAEAANN